MKISVAFVLSKVYPNMVDFSIASKKQKISRLTFRNRNFQHIVVLFLRRSILNIVKSFYHVSYEF